MDATSHPGAIHSQDGGEFVATGKMRDIYDRLQIKPL